MRKRYVCWTACLVILLGTFVTVQATSAATFEVTSPWSHTYTEGIDFTLFIGDGFSGFPSAPGDVTAPLQFVDNFGLLASDFSNFIPGNIALIERGMSPFSDKVNLADDAGAIGVIIFDNVNQPLPNPTLFDETYIPSIFTTYNIAGDLFLALYAGQPVVVHIFTTETTSTPEPATMVLLGLGIAGLVGFRKRFK